MLGLACFLPLSTPDPSGHLHILLCSHSFLVTLSCSVRRCASGISAGVSTVCRSVICYHSTVLIIYFSFISKIKPVSLHAPPPTEGLILIDTSGTNTHLSFQPTSDIHHLVIDPASAFSVKISLGVFLLISSRI